MHHPQITPITQIQSDPDSNKPLSQHRKTSTHLFCDLLFPNPRNLCNQRMKFCVN